MRTHFRLYCPHCKELMKSTTGPISYGNPIKNCPKCGKPYIDPNCTEPALQLYKPRSVWRLFRETFPGGGVIALFIALIANFTVADDTTSWIIFGISFPVCGLLLFFWFFSSRKELEEKRLKRWQESDQRLRDPKHATILKLYGYLVPAQYLPPRYWEKKDTLTYPGATISSPGSFGKKEKNPKPHMPGGSDKY